MTSRLRGSAKEEPKPATSLLSSKSRTYLGSGRESREKSNFDESRNKVSRKDSRGKYDSFPERSSETKYDTNGYRSPPPDDALAEEDPDLLYRRSRDHFGSWKIQDVIGERESKGDRKSRFDIFKSNESKRTQNGSSKHKSPTKERRLDSNDRKHQSKSRSPEYIDRDEMLKSNKKNLGYDRTRAKDHDDDYRPRKNRDLLREIENFGNKRGLGAKTEPTESTERRYAGNGPSPELDPNDKIRLLIDRFKSNDETRPTDGPKGDRKSREKSEDRQANGKLNSLDKKNPHRRSRDVDDDKRFGSVSRKWKENHDDKGTRRETVPRNGVNDDEIQNYRSLERDKRDPPGDSGGFRKRSDTYSVERGARKPRDSEDSSKRKSYVYSGSPADGFDVTIQRYERALTGPRKDPELGNRKAEVKRRSSLNIKDESNEPHERNGRHSRPLTPPENEERKFDERRTNFIAKDWYESNKQFAAKYLRDNSKLRSPSEDRNDEPRETYFGDRRRDSPEDLKVFHPIHQKQMSSLQRMDHTETNGESKVSRKSNRNSMEFDRSNGRGESVTIKIRNHAEDRSENERRTKRGVFLNSNDQANARNTRRYDDDSPTRDRRGTRDKDWTSSTTPARKIWNYKEGGAQITDVDEGQPCLKCGDTCTSGFLQHSWRKNCSTCKCPREAHDVCHEEWVSVRSRLGLKGDGASGSVACDPRELGLAWAPPGLPSHKVEEYFSMLPEISVPRLGTPGERYRDRQLATQLPKQDLAKAYCRHLATEHYTSADDFMAARNEIALDIGTVQEVLDKGANCAGCHESLKYGSLAVSAGKLGELYHPACFQCVECRELLVDLAYCVYNDAVYCERHYAERLKGRCAACDELIFSGEFTKAMNKDWHSGHFCCWQCDESLTGQRYVLRDEHPYCIKCYESVFANGCEECSKIIGIDSKDLSYKDKHWHEACFLCNKCRVSLVDKQFGSKVDKIYCGNCYDAQFASRCDGCGEIFRAGTKKMEYKTRQWHEKCFCCVVCKNAIGTKSFIPREQEIYCSGCYEDKFATRCVKCNKIITSGGVTYKNEPWHRECFTCSNCSTSLAGQRFTSRDEKPYCADCFGELFAKRCTACTKPITGIGGTRFISFEDRHWHNDCFICAGCKTSLVGRGFITDADDIICPECAKQKLM